MNVVPTHKSGRSIRDRCGISHVQISENWALPKLNFISLTSVRVPGGVTARDLPGVRRLAEIQRLHAVEAVTSSPRTRCIERGARTAFRNRLRTETATLCNTTGFPLVSVSGTLIFAPELPMTDCT